MDQNVLSEWEHKCIQEEPTECSAACPIHVDIKTFLYHVQREEWGAALAVMRKTMPLPGILGRICDAPCESPCTRKELGGTISIGAIERACVQMDLPSSRSFPVPKKDKHIAVIGSGLSGLTVAWDLSKKGYQVTVLEPDTHVGGPLLDIGQGELDYKNIETEISVLKKRGVTFQLDVNIDKNNFLKTTRAEFDALYLSMECQKDMYHWFQLSYAQSIHITPKLQTSSVDGVFGGGNSEKSQKSVVWQAAEGRWAATSIERYLQNVSLTAGREKEGPVQTRLYTSLIGVVTQQKVSADNPHLGYTPIEASREAARCLQCECKECVKVCPYLEKFKAYPKKYVREIHNNATVVAGAHKANNLINGCSLCGLCEEVCPENFSMQDLCLTAREEMVLAGYMPQSTHEFALQDMEFSKSNKFFLARHAPDTIKSRYVFYPGCQLAATSPDQVREVYNYLRTSLEGGVGLILDCCSAPTYWGGRIARTDENMAAFENTWSELGKPSIILACSSCYFMFKKHLPDLDILSLWEVLEKDDSLVCNQDSRSGPLAIHDPCTTRHEGHIQKSVRALMNRYQIQTEEFALSKEKTTCCGFGGLMQNAQPDLAKDVITQRANESTLDYITYCSMCRDSMAMVGKRAVHLLDLFFPTPGDVDPANRACSGWSERRENRARLKSELLIDLWGEKSEALEAYETIPVVLAQGIGSKLEERRILISDIQQVIHHSVLSGDRFIQPETGYYKASYRPYHATFWIEYSVTEDGYTVHNAYTHRMAVILEGGQ